MSNHVFISYVREDYADVDKLCHQLQNAGIEVWLDREKIKPGQRWQSAIRNAIRQGAFFIVCFSDNYNKKNRSYAQEELIQAIDELRLRPQETNWFIPVRLNDCKIPDRSIGAGQYISDIQWEDLFKDWTKSVARIISVVKSVNLEHTDQQSLSNLDVSVTENKEHLSRQVFLKLFSPIDSFQDHYIGYGLDKNPMSFNSMKRLIYENLQENLPILTEELIVAWMNIDFIIKIGEAPLADIKLLELIGGLLIMMEKTVGEQSFIPNSIKKELPTLKNNYQLWNIFSVVSWDAIKAAKLLKIVLHLNRNTAAEVLSNERFDALIEEFNGSDGYWRNSLRRRQEFFAKMSLEIFKVRWEQSFPE